MKLVWHNFTHVTLNNINVGEKKKQLLCVECVEKLQYFLQLQHDSTCTRREIKNALFIKKHCALQCLQTLHVLLQYTSQGHSE